MVVAIVEDNREAARLLKELLEAEGVQVDGLFRSGEEALAVLEGGQGPEVVFMDLGLPGITGVETTRQLKARYGDRLDVIVQTMYEDVPTILEAIKAGVSGYLLKGFAPEELVASLDEVRRGGSFLTGKVARKILVELGTVPETPTGFRLTDRETEILQLLVEGLSYKEIGQRLFLSTFTVNNHLRKVYEKMRVGSRHEATTLWLKTQGTTGCED